MNGSAEAILEDDDLDTLDESYDWSFDESDLSSAEFLPLIGPALGAIAPAIGRILPGILGGGPSRPPLPPVRPRPSGPGVSTATLATPGGSATMRLPEPVVTQREFREVTSGLSNAINAERARINTTQNDLRSLTQRVGTVVADTQRQVAQVRTTTSRDLLKVRQEQRAAIARMRREQSSQQMMSMMMSMMLQRQQQGQLEDHTHATPDGTAEVDGDSSALMLLPLMMMNPSDSSSSGGDNNMMMMMMMVLLMDR